MTAGVCMLVPAVSAGAKLVPATATVMALAGVRFAVTGGYQLTGSADRPPRTGRARRRAGGPPQL